ncbi:MAG: ECF transporter S component [Clostridia bacterium]|nr:ECF transporter S component [Clostridiales bacterium]MBR2030004.1 ECF transporter S component [Clostridia bacterium]MBR2302507.1 ECF transporter S component [Clostridia bacterium]
MEKTHRKEELFSAKNIAKIAVLTAVAYVLYMFVKFPLPMLFPAFLDIQFSDLPALIGGFAMGPWAGCLIVIIKCLLKMPFSSTACVGEIADIIMGVAFVLPAAILYKKAKSKKSAFVGVIIGAVCCVVASVLANWLLLIPFYAQVFGWDAILGMVSSLYANVTQASFYTYYILLAVIPFNVLRCSIVVAFTFLLYKRVSPILHR